MLVKRRRLLSSIGIATGVGAGLITGSEAAASAPAGLIGTWSLRSWRAIAADGEISYPFGREAQGRITYEPSGRMSVQLMRRDRPRFASDDPKIGTPQEFEEAFRGFFAYFGAYRVDSRQGVVIHAIEACSFPNWIGREQVRHFTLQGDQLVLQRKPSPPAPGSDPAPPDPLHELTWDRLPS